MKCPKCGLINPDSALRCDCGYDFAVGRVKESYLSQSRSSQQSGGSSNSKKKNLKTFVILFALFSPVSMIVCIGIFSGWGAASEVSYKAGVEVIGMTTATIALVVFAALITYPMARVYYAYRQRRGESGVRSAIRTQTDQILEIVPQHGSSESYGFFHQNVYTVVPQMTADRAKRSVRLVWKMGKEDTLDYGEMKRIVATKEGVAPVVTLFKREAGYIFYTIYLEMSDDRRILVAKERNKKGAESLATVIAEFLNLGILYSENLLSNPTT